MPASFTLIVCAFPMNKDGCRKFSTAKPPVGHIGLSSLLKKPILILIILIVRYQANFLQFDTA